MALSIEGQIVWVNGPFKAGSNSDLSIFRRDLREKLRENELIICDSIYIDNTCAYKEGVPDYYAKNIRARHENMFSRFKTFNVLAHKYRHSIGTHVDCFYAVANLLQISFQIGEKLFRIE